jgi:hypothetical protein
MGLADLKASLHRFRLQSLSDGLYIVDRTEPPQSGAGTVTLKGRAPDSHGILGFRPNRDGRNLAFLNSTTLELELQTG